MTNLLEVVDLRTSFDTERGTVTAVDGASFTVAPGEVVGIVGESGCGKSVTAESILQLLDPASTTYSGQVRFGGEDLLTFGETAMRRIRGNRISMIFQDPMSALNPVFTIGDQLTEAILAHRRIGKQRARSEATELLEKTGIPEPQRRMRQYPHQLSGGQRQRVMIAMALSCDPELLIADEPTTALDVTTQSQILKLLIELKDEFDAGILFITHDLGVVAEICDRVVVMYLGEVVESANVHTLFDSPAHPYTRGLLASTPDIASDPSIDLPIIPGTVPTLHNVPVGCRFADRCSFVLPECRDRPIDLEVLSDGHSSRCIRSVKLFEDSAMSDGVAR
ncbi:ABC transporter ATP-binding protein [Brevibacterium sp. ZH18]|uniref:ABC transporter ATP-binding protein n=1 Tax=Brevibacterium sp. ZH18 TaxID=2927784 RepID=UPI001F604D92|nr:ABC transporter ATP-binding protein [Brevibacterium sp. ZH18]MCI4011116.1 ABC transporter ATP-binding protein [Brevibacterium sp. ZH18]